MSDTRVKFATHETASGGVKTEVTVELGGHEFRVNAHSYPDGRVFVQKSVDREPWDQLLPGGKEVER